MMFRPSRDDSFTIEETNLNTHNMINEERQQVRKITLIKEKRREANIACNA